MPRITDPDLPLRENLSDRERQRSLHPDLHNDTNRLLNRLVAEINAIPRITVGRQPPSVAEEGDIWIELL